MECAGRVVSYFTKDIFQMGMDVYGKKPTSKVGKYFRNTVWYWGPLSLYICKVAPQIAVKCKSWGNDGYGLSSSQSRALADILEREIVSGRCEAYAKTRDAMGTELSFLEGGYFTVENVRSFAAFLRDCGGFRIY